MRIKGRKQTGAEGGGASSIRDAEPVDWDSRRDFLLPFPVVALGASAGGVETLQRFFRAMPADSGCAFVVIMHLAPELESNLDAVLGKATRMRVAQVSHDTPVQPNHVYVAPPGHEVTIRHGSLMLEKVLARPPKPTAIDSFMISLASDQGEHAVAVVMSGSDGDGSLGIKAIKSEGGFTIAQLPSSAAHPGMPLSAVATGAVDKQLTIEEMPAALAELARHPATRSELPMADGATTDAKLLNAILGHVQSSVDLDFRGYKTPMLIRRIRRRMGLCGVPSEADYLRHLMETSGEAEALARDFLISVTEFFREPEAWQTWSETIVPELLKAKDPGGVVRVWVPGCATGEEAYSIAMTFLEHPAFLERRVKLQVFATDIDRMALDTARRGCYPEAMHHSVNPDRLSRFFTMTDDGFRVKKELREVLTFAPQNLVRDPPFSHLDVVSCRNLLIYMQPELQRRVLEILHFALDPGGLLALGKSETTGHHADLFTPVSQQARIFRRTGPARIAGRRPPLPIAGMTAGRGAATAAPVPRIDYNRLIREALLDHRIAAAVVTNPAGRALFFYGPMQAYLEPAQGAPNDDLFATVLPNLRPHLRALLHQAAKAQDPAEAVAMLAQDNGVGRSVRLVASRVGPPAADLLLVTFEPQHPGAEAAGAPSEPELTAMRALEEELRAAKQELRATIGELETANEELKVAHEESMAANEELQSSNEELQTSKEELQAMNEELTTVNNQLMEKVGELESVNDDLSNLLSSSYIPTLFLDRQLNIKRFTPAAARLFRLIPGDVERPVIDLAAFRNLEMLTEDALQVLESLVPIEREMRLDGGGAYLRRTLPYRTLQEKVEGVVVTFTDVTELKRAFDGLRRYAAVVRDSNDAVIVHDRDGRILAWNRGAQAMYGHPSADIIGMNIRTLLPDEVRENYDAYVRRTVAGERLVGIEMRRRRQDGTVFDVSSTFSLVPGDEGEAAAIALTDRDISQKKQLETATRASEERFRLLANQAPVLIWISDPDGNLEFVNKEFARFTGHGEQDLVHRRLAELFHPEDARQGASLFSTRAAPGTRREATARLRAAGADYRWVKLTAGTQDGGKVVGSMVDVDAQVSAEQAMREANRRKDEFLAMLGHELRNPLVPIRNAAEVLNQIAGEDSRLGWVRDTLVRQVEHVTRLVDDLLDISMITRGTISLHLEPVDLNFVVKRACESISGIMQRKRHRFDCTVPDETLWAEGDAVRLAQVLENLLTNAAKYTEDGGEVMLRLEREGDQAVVHVSDNGLGIDSTMLTRMFDLFVQDERAIDRSQGGLGIGLALVRHLVELHHGHIFASSEGRGKGSRITFRLPLLRTAQLPPPSAPACETERGSGRILVVDDDVDAGESMEVLLGMYGYEVRRAVDLPSALEAARHFRPRVVILDLALPGADGFEVARRLRALPEMEANVDYLSLSGFGQPQDFRHSEEAGFLHHLVKPANPVKLRAILKRLLGRPAADA